MPSSQENQFSLQNKVIVLPLLSREGCLGPRRWNSAGILGARPAAAGACPAPGGPPGCGTPRLPAPSTGAPRWGCWAGWSSALLHLHSVQTQAPLSPRHRWHSPNPSCKWNVSDHKNTTTARDFIWARAWSRSLLATGGVQCTPLSQACRQWTQHPCEKWPLTRYLWFCRCLFQALLASRRRMDSLEP